MRIFSLRIGKNNLEFDLRNAPGFLRIRFLNEILNYFIDVPGLSFSSLTLLSICDAFCVGLNLQDAVSATSQDFVRWEYISDVIRTCHWYEFFDIVEIVGQLIATEDLQAVERHSRVADSYDDLLTDIWADTMIKLESFSFDIYHQKMNQLFISTSTSYQLTKDGTVSPISKEGIVDLQTNALNHENHQQTNASDVLRKTETDIDILLEIIIKSELVDEKNRESIFLSSQLYIDKNYQDSLRLLYPSLESVINNLIIKGGRKPGDFTGLVKKVEWLELEGHLPPNLSNTMRLFKDSRNVIVHGDNPPPDDLLEPMCNIAFRYLTQLIKNYDPDLAQ